MKYGYAVLERTNSLGLACLDGEVFLNYEEAVERSKWLADHLTGSYADAGDTTCEVVGIELSNGQYADLLDALDVGLVG